MKRKVLITVLILALCLLTAGCGAGSGRQPVQEADTPDTAGAGQQPENSAPDTDGTVPAGQCGVAALSITAQEPDGAYTVELAGFLLLAGG